MKVVQPRVVTDAILTATNLVETDNQPYAPTATYAKGARVRRASVFDFTGGGLPAGATLTRAGSATYTASNGSIAAAAANVARFEYGQDGLCRGLLIEPQRTNYVTNSADQSLWGAQYATQTTDVTASPDGTVTADKIAETGSTQEQVRYRTLGTAAQGRAVFSAYAKPDGRNFAHLSIDENSAASWIAGTFDVSAGSVTKSTNGTSSSTIVGAGISSAARGFYRCYVEGNRPNTSGSGYVYLGPCDQGARAYNAGYGLPGYQGTAGLGIDAWGAQVEVVAAGEASGPTSYIPTTSAAATRAADVLILNWASKGASDGTYTARYTFDDGSTQELPAVVASGVATVPTASLNRTILLRVQLTALLDGVRIYESLQANNIGHALTDAAWWIDVGPTNRWAMFDGAVGSLSRATGSISVTLKPDVPIDALAVLEVTATSVRVQISAGGASVFDQTKAAGAAPSSLTFLALPAAASATVTVTITGANAATPVSAGALLMGNMADLGLTEAGPSIGINDFSKRQTDDFGVTSVVERGWAKRMSIRSKVDTSAVADLQQRLTTLRALPSLWIGEEGFDSLIIYGFFKEFAVDLALDTISFCTITIEGMTSAADLDQDTAGTIDALAGQVNAALAKIAVIQSDGYLSAGEKPDIIRQVTDIGNEYPDIVAKAAALAVPSVSYATAFAALINYLGGLAPAFDNTSLDTGIVPATFNARFADYYLARTALLNGVTAKAATMATWAGTNGAGKPADNATRNDQAGNDITAPADPATWIFYNGAIISTAIAGRPRAQLLTATARVDFSGLISCNGGAKIYFRYVVSSDGGAGEPCNASVYYRNQDGSIGAINLGDAPYNSKRRLEQVLADTVVEGSFVLPATARAYALYVERPVFTTNSFFIDKPYSGTAQPGADITLQAQIVIAEIPSIDYAADYMNVVPADAKSVVRTVQPTRGGISIRLDPAVTYALANVSDSLKGANGNLAIGNGTDDRGTITLSQFSGPGTADVIVSYNGQPLLPAKKLVVTVTPGPPPVSSGGTGGGGGGGGGGSAASGNLSGQSLSSTALVELYKFAGVVVASGKTITATAALQYDITGTAVGSRTPSAKFQYAPTGSSTWTDLGALQTGSAAAVVNNGDGPEKQSGTLNFGQTVSPSAATYDVRLVAAINTSGRSISFGTSPITASVSA